MRDKSVSPNHKLTVPTQSPLTLTLTWKVYNWKTHAVRDRKRMRHRAHVGMQHLLLDLDILERTKLPFLLFGNKPTFTSSCLKLLLNICNTVSKETVRGSMKFSNSSSSSPIKKHKRAPRFKCTLLCESLSSERRTRAEKRPGKGRPAFTSCRILCFGSLTILVFCLLFLHQMK